LGFITARYFCDYTNGAAAVDKPAHTAASRRYITSQTRRRFRRGFPQGTSTYVLTGSEASLTGRHHQRIRPRSWIFSRECSERGSEYNTFAMATARFVARKRVSASSLRVPFCDACQLRARTHRSGKGTALRGSTIWPKRFQKLTGNRKYSSGTQVAPPLFERKRQPTDEYLTEEEIYKLDGAKLVAVTKFRQLRWITVNEEWRSR